MNMNRKYISWIAIAMGGIILFGISLSAGIFMLGKLVPIDEGSQGSGMPLIQGATETSDMAMASKDMSSIAPDMAGGSATGMDGYRSAVAPSSMISPTSQAVVGNTVTVTGKAELKVVPDIAYLSVSIETSGNTAKSAQSANEKALKAVNQALRETGNIDINKDIRSTGYYVQPNYSYNDLLNTSRITGYTAVHSLEIATRNLLGMNELIEGTIDAGVNRVDGIRLDTEKKEQYEVQALNQALDNAKRKASALAQAAGRTLGPVNHIAESYVQSSPLYSAGYLALSKDVAALAGSSTVQVGEITVSAEVLVSYKLN